MTSLKLVDANGNDLLVERIDYGPHPLSPRQLASAAARCRAAGPCPTGQAEVVVATTNNCCPDAGNRKCQQHCLSVMAPDGDVEFKMIFDQFRVVYTYSASTVSSGDRVGSVESVTGSGSATVVRSCTPYYVSSSRRCCCCCCCHHHSTGNAAADLRTGCQMG